MPDQNFASVESQIRSHPQFRAWAQAYGRHRGAHVIPGDVLRAAGINVPDGYLYSLDMGRVFEDWGLSDKIMTGIALGGMGAGIGAGIASGAAGASGGASGASASQAAASGLLPQTAPGAASAALTGVVPGLGLGNTGNLAGSAVGSFGPAVTGASASLLDKIKSSLSSPDGLASLAGIIGGLTSGGVGGGGNGASDEQMDQLLEHAVRRTERTDPLHQAVTQLAFSRLPVSARNGIQLTGK